MESWAWASCLEVFASYCSTLAKEQSLDIQYIFLFALAALLIAVLVWMLFGSRSEIPVKKEPEGKIRGYCPICGEGLRKGERIRSSQVEIGNIEIQTRIKGCPYCMDETNKKKRTCPICKNPLALDQVILASADPRVDKNKLSIRGCKQCWPQGFK
ncbi:MAG: hypothetical protein K8S54_18635 [Spirochaetia bacterium]|nr:hypothetical protein [Spirochaetia bacterium]